MKRSYQTMGLDTIPGVVGLGLRSPKLRCRVTACKSHPVSEFICQFRSSAIAPFLSEICCQWCSAEWTVCLECPNSKKQFIDIHQLNDHIRHSHKTFFASDVRSRKRRGFTENDRYCEPSLPANPGILHNSHNPLFSSHEPIDDCAMSAEDEDCVLEHQITQQEVIRNPQPEDVPGLGPGVRPISLSRASDITAAIREASREFFFRDQTGDGTKYLAARAQFGRPNIPPHLLDPVEVSMIMQTAELASSLPKADRLRLAKYTNTVCDVVKKQTLEEVEVAANRQSVRPWTLLPITSAFQMRRQMKDGSIDSIMHTVPHVHIMEIGSHAVSLPSDCLQDLAGHGFPLDFVPNRSDADKLPQFPVTSISSTTMCRQLFDINQYNQPILADFNVWIFEWSDDFEPNSSLTKSNRGGVWVKTITIGPPGTHDHLMAYTYPIAMGPKNASHEEAEIVIRENLLRLSSHEGVVVYSKEHDGLVRIRGKLIVSLQDQPERRGENYLTGGSSDFHRRFGYSFPWQEYEHQLRPCPACRTILFDMETPWFCPPCLECTNFAYDLNHPMLHYDEGADELFGTPDGVMKLSYQILADAVELAHDGFVAGDWELLEVHRWLKMHCIKLECVTSILLHADKCKEFHDVMDVNANSSDALKEAVTQEKNRRPHLYTRWPLPAVWTRGVNLDQHPDIPMHLLCLGIVKTVILRVSRWMAKKCKGKAFVRQMKGLLESLQKLHLSWCPVLPYKGGKFGGWVSENYLTMSRLLKWFYSVLDEIAPDDKPWSEPDRPMKDWTGEDCKHWLKLRGLLVPKYAAQRREKVTNYRAKHLSDQPSVVEQMGGPVEKVQEVVVALDRMMAWIMVGRIDDEGYYTELERKIRVFLTSFADMEEALSRKNTLPAWLSSFNFLSLLNLPDIVRQYGPIRNIWEGYWVGEGILRFIKPELMHGLKKYWERSTMKSLMRRKGMQAVKGGKTEDESEEDALYDDDGESSSAASDTATDGNDDDHQLEDLEVDTGTNLFHCYKSVREIDDTLRRTNKVVSGIVVDGQLGIACIEHGECRFIPINRGALQSFKMDCNYFFFERGDRPEDGAPYQVLDVSRIEEESLFLPRIQVVAFEDPRFVRNTFAVIDRSHRSLDSAGCLRQ
jgi:hypothetical protein